MNDIQATINSITTGHDILGSSIYPSIQYGYESMISHAGSTVRSIYIDRLEDFSNYSVSNTISGP